MKLNQVKTRYCNQYPTRWTTSDTKRFPHLALVTKMNPLVTFTQMRKILSMLFSSIQANPEITFYYSVPALSRNVCNGTGQHPLWAQTGTYGWLRPEVPFWGEFPALVWFSSQRNLAVLTWFPSDQSRLELFPCTPGAGKQPRFTQPSQRPPEAIAHPKMCHFLTALFQSTDLLLLQRR